MAVTAVAVSLLLAVAMLAGGVAKLLRAAPVVANLGAVGVPARAVPALGAVEVTATVGLLAGLLLWWPFGLAAAIGSVAYFVGAIVAHLRAQNRDVGPAVAMLVLSVAALVVLAVVR